MPRGLVRYQKCGQMHFLTFSCYKRFPYLLQAEARNLFESALERIRRKYQFIVAGYVVMPDHIHLLITVDGEMTIEKAMQLVKGRFSYRLKKELGYNGEVWQHGFSEVRANDGKSFLRHREYIAQNPVTAGLAESADGYPFCYGYLAKQKARRG